jgi:hypothetical protein
VALQARRPRRTTSGSINSSSTGRDRLIAISNSARMRASSLNATNSAESSVDGDLDLKNTIPEKTWRMQSSSATSSKDASSPSRRPTMQTKNSMIKTLLDSSAVETISPAKGGVTKSTGRPCDEKEDYRRQPQPDKPLVAGSRYNNSILSGQQDTEEQEFPFRPVTTSDVGTYDETDQRNRMELLEAQAGVPVLLPGAFAVGGSNDDDDDVDGYDSGFEDANGLVDDGLGDDDAPPEHRADIEMAQRTGSIDPSIASNAPLEAELYVESFVAAEILIEEDDTDVKGNRRRSIASMSCIVFVIMLVIGIIVGIMIPNQDDGIVENQTEDEGIPIIEGWLQVGETLEGPADKDSHTILFGEAVAIAADGTRIAVGLPGASDPLNTALKRAGSVKIYDWINGTTWKESGTIVGMFTSGESGKCVELSNDGKRVAISGPSIDSIGNGHVAVYQEIDVGSWELVGDSIEGGEKYGDSLDFSADGRIVAVGDRSAKRTVAGGEVTGVVQIFQDVNDTWIQMGSDLIGGDQFGWSISLSADGHRLVVSTPESKTSTGIIQAFDFNGQSWEEIGRPVKGETEKESFSVAIALSGDGSILASGAPRYSKGGRGLGPGIVRTFRFDENEQIWSPYGQPLEGANQLDVFGSSVSLSFNGEVLAVGGPQNNNFCDSCGNIQVFQNQQGNWSRIGSELGNGEMDGGQYGSSIALSYNGTRLIGGAPSTTYNGYISKVGQVIVFDNILETNASTM